MECNFENCGYYVDEECTICGMGTDGEDTFCKYCKDNPNCYYKKLAELKAENERLYEEKDCLHKIIDRLLENAGYSKDIASAEDFEDVYENMQYKNNKLEEYKQTLQEIKEILSQAMDVKSNAYNHFFKVEQAIDLITKAKSEGRNE